VLPSLLALALAGTPVLAAVPSVTVARALAAAPAGGARAVAATQPLVGHPYAPSPLGEEAGDDPDPRFRLDAFDCMTFAETAVALGSAETLAEARRALDDVRYDGAPALEHRHHEVLSQWIPANVARGWIREITAEVAPGRVRREEKVYSPESWDVVRRAGRAIAGLPRARLPLGRYAVEVIAPADVPPLERSIPPGTLAFLVRADAPDRATRITHVGLVVPGPGGSRRVRHATSTRGVSRVIEEPIARFLAREARARPAWPVAGVALFEILDNRAHLSGALAGLSGASRVPGAPLAR
jgi:hypothetical protein